MKWLDQLPLAPLVLAAVLLGLAPFKPEPHLVEKLRFLAEGQLTRPLDIFDLVLHGVPSLVLLAKLVRLIYLKKAAG